MNRLFAVGDIHGCFDTFHELLVNRLKLERSDRIILLGDYIDRGDKSKEVIDFIIDLISRAYDVIPLAGNHEVMLLESFRNPILLPVWMMNSGETTLKSFGAGGVRKIEDKYIEFFSTLKYFHREGDFVFVHAGLNDECEDPFSDTDGMIWESRMNYSNPLLDNITVIHGHRPKTVEYILEKISSGSKVIPIDTGCVYNEDKGYGFLSALELKTMKLTSVARI